MSFTGSINSDVRRWFGNIAPKLKNSFIVVGCSGNFTVEQLITRNTSPEYIWSNDVTLYSSVLGAYLCDEEFDLTITDKKFSFIEPFLDSTESKAAIILIMSEALKYEKCKNPFEERIWNHYKSNFVSYHEKTIIKIRDRKQKVKIDKYTAKDIADLLNEIPKQSIVIAFMLTYVGGYEKLYKRLEEVFSWPRPQYKIIDKEAKEEILKSMMRFSFIYIDDQEKENLPPTAMVQKRAFKSVYLYSNIDFKRKYYIRNKMNFEKSSFEMLSDDHEITPKWNI